MSPFQREIFNNLKSFLLESNFAQIILAWTKSCCFVQDSAVNFVNFVHPVSWFIAIFILNSQFRHVNHSEISDQSDHCKWNHHCNDAILSHTPELVAYARWNVFTKFEDYGESKCFSLNILSDALQWCDMMHNVRKRWAIDERKGGGGISPRLPFHNYVSMISFRM